MLSKPCELSDCVLDSTIVQSCTLSCRRKDEAEVTRQHKTCCGTCRSEGGNNISQLFSRGMSGAVSASLSVGRTHCIPTLTCGYDDLHAKPWSEVKITKYAQTDFFMLCCFFSLQAHLSFMRYISVCCVVGIIAGFCIGPGKLLCTVC